jgi:hypothetical protein
VRSPGIIAVVLAARVIAMHTEYVLCHVNTIVLFILASPPVSIDRPTAIHSGTCDAVGDGRVHFIR